MTPVEETYAVRIRTDASGRRAERVPIRIPFEAVTGHYHQLSDRALNDLIKDLSHEQMRRQGWLG